MNELPPRLSRVILVSLLLISGCGLMSWAWINLYKRLVPPTLNIVESPAEWWKDGTPGKLVVEIAKERGYNLHAPFVTQEEAERRVRRYEMMKAGSWVALVGGGAMVVCALAAIIRMRDR